jgi:hypothetical protein
MSNLFIYGKNDQDGIWTNNNDHEWTVTLVSLVMRNDADSTLWLRSTRTGCKSPWSSEVFLDNFHDASLDNADEDQ